MTGKIKIDSVRPAQLELGYVAIVGATLVGEEETPARIKLYFSVPEATALVLQTDQVVDFTGKITAVQRTWGRNADVIKINGIKSTTPITDFTFDLRGVVLTTAAGAIY